MLCARYPAPHSSLSECVWLVQKIETRKKMDVQTGLVYVAVVVISALVIGLVSVFAMKEKSYEEAIAEQRKLPDDLLLGKKEKGKEKKHKTKTGKKVKEKKEEKEEKEEKPDHVQFEETPQVLPPEPPVQESGKSKKKGKVDKVKPILVNKDEPVVIITEPSPSQPVLSPESNHFDVIQPKDNLELIRSHSRENLHHISQSESVINKSPKETPTKVKKNTKDKDSKKKDDNKNDKKESLHQQINKELVQETKEKLKELFKESKEIKEPKESIKETVVPVQSSNKESKKVKKKNDILAQIGGDKDGVNFSLLNTLVQKAEISRSEIQFLIDQLLNKQQDNPQEHAEWTESRADPVVKLKKQLADKEKALKDEQEASVSVQNKLLELRAELNGERSRFTASIRQLEEALNTKITEAQTLHTRMQHILESHAAEKQSFNRQIEQLQSKVNDEAAVIAKLKEDQGHTKSQMQQELIDQRKQLEDQYAQIRENEAALKAQLVQKHVEYQELQNVNMTMSQELQATCESSTEEIETLMVQLRSMEYELIMNGDAMQNIKKKLEESQRVQHEMDQKIKNMHRSEQELQNQLTYLQSELDSAKTEITSLKDELSKTQSELAKSKADVPHSLKEANNADEVIILQSQLNARKQELDNSETECKRFKSIVEKAEVLLNDFRNDLKSTTLELTELQEKYNIAQSDLVKYKNDVKEADLNTVCLQDSLDDLWIEHRRLEDDYYRLKELQNSEEIKKEINQLREKNELLTNQLAASVDRLPLEGRENGIEEKAQKDNIQLVENTKLLTQKEDELVSLKTTLTYKEKEVNLLNSQINSLRCELNKQQKIISTLRRDLVQQRSTNNDLRRKNWKVMEALNSAESRIKNNRELNIDVQKFKIEEQEATKALLQRIFPEIKISEKSYDQWIKVFEKQVYTAINRLESNSKPEDVNPELEKTNKNLQAMVNHYKQIIYDTEGMLNQLQSHIESEEKRWQSQLRLKENEVSNLRIEINELRNKTLSKELQKKISELEARLLEAESLKSRGKSESQNLNSPNPQNRIQNLAALEQLQEEKARLSEQLQNESSKKVALDAEIAKMRLHIETTESNLIKEKRIVSQLQQEVIQLKGEICGSSTNSDQSTLNGPPIIDSPKSEGGSEKK